MSSRSFCRKRCRSSMVSPRCVPPVRRCAYGRFRRSSRATHRRPFRRSAARSAEGSRFSVIKMMRYSGRSPRRIAESQDGGYFSNFGNAGFIWSHGCASDVHTSTCGLNQLGSSKLAVLIATNWKTASGLTTIGEPQSGQKPRRVLPPISLGEAWKRSEPCKSLKASVGTMAKDENGPPLDRWQSRQ